MTHLLPPPLTPETFHTVNVMARDANQNFAIITLSVIIRPNRDPVCVAATVSPNRLWPPNHGLVPVTISGITDPDGDVTTVRATGVTQDEPTNGSGDGDTSPDATITGATGAVIVRAERAGTGDRRVYRIAFIARDPKGGSCIGTVRVDVPKNPNSTVIDSGGLFDSLVP
jgi:hypothetical protein